MDNVFVTIAVAVMYALMLLASNAPATPTEQVNPPQGAVIDTGLPPSPPALDDTWRVPLFPPYYPVAPDSATTDTIKPPFLLPDSTNQKDSIR